MVYKSRRLIVFKKDEQWTTSFVALLLAFCAFINSVSCKSAAIVNSHILASERRYNEPRQGDYNEAGSIDWKISKDNIDVYNILSAGLEKIMKKSKRSFRHSYTPQYQRHKRSQKRASYVDKRGRVPPAIDGQMFPYVASVKISSGCTGTLVGPKHVLTAAHCVFSREGTKIKKLKVGFMQRSGKIRWKKVRRSYVPREWHKSVKKIHKILNDYAILELKREMYGRRYMKHASLHHKEMLATKIRLIGFPKSKQSGTIMQWSTRCRIAQKLKYSFISKVCYVGEGMSGAAAISHRTNTYKAIGILVANAIITQADNKKYRVAVINPLTQEKRRNICKWMKAGRCLR